MLVDKDKHKFLMTELSIRCNNLIHILEGRNATREDSQHGLSRGHWTEGRLANSKVVDRPKLQLAIADFKSILTEIAREK